MPDDAIDITMLLLPEGPRLTCTGCAQFLYEGGMLEVEHECVWPATDVPKLGPARVRVFRFANGVTLDDCQRAVRHRHRTEELGE